MTILPQSLFDDLQKSLLIGPIFDQVKWKILYLGNTLIKLCHVF